MAVSKIVAGGMLRTNTPVEDYREEYGLWVKREDKACVIPGPPFSKARGVYARVLSRPEKLIGVLDTRHSQGGWAVARACQILGKECVVYYPEFKYEPGPKSAQLAAQVLGAKLVGIPAGRSAILYHQMKREVVLQGGYPMPNALKLEESISETAKEVPRDLRPKIVLVSISSGTIAAGVIRGLGAEPVYLIHLGYSRSLEEVSRYLRGQSGVASANLVLVDERYSYADSARDGETPSWPCNEFYDLKAFRWWMRNRKDYAGPTLFWNVG